MNTNCKHKWIYSRSDSYKCFERYSYTFYHADYYYCEKCLDEKVIEKRHDCSNSELWKLPDWARLITKQIDGHGNN